MMMSYYNNVFVKIAAGFLKTDLKQAVIDTLGVCVCV